MPLQVTQKREADVPMPGRTGKVNQDIVRLKSEMEKIAPGSVLEIQANDRSARGLKAMVTRASKELGQRWRHWSVGSTVYAQPMAARRRPGRPRKVRP